MMMIIIVIIIIAIMIMMIKTIIIAVIINTPFQSEDFSTRSTAGFIQPIWIFTFMDLFRNFIHIFSFVCAKQLLEPQSKATTATTNLTLQNNHGFKKIEDIIHFYEETRRLLWIWSHLLKKILMKNSTFVQCEKVNELFQSEHTNQNTPKLLYYSCDITITNLVWKRNG